LTGAFRLAGIGVDQLAQEAATAVDAAARNCREDAADRDEMRRRTTIAGRLKRALADSE
jgi:hypothetical protein